MRTLFIAVALLLAAIVAYTQLVANGGEKSTEQLRFIPADTALLSVHLDPINFSDYLAMQVASLHNPEETIELLTTVLDTAGNSNTGYFIAALMEHFQQLIDEPDQASAVTGIAAEFQALFYLVGASPVLRLELDNEQNFWRWFDRIETQSQLWHESAELDSVSYRRYALFPMSEHNLELLVSAHNGWGTLVLTSSAFDPEHHATALAIRKPADPLNWRQDVTPVASNYQLDDATFGWFSSAELLKAITSTDQNRLAKDLHQLFGSELAAQLADWHSPACQADTAIIASNWPGIFFDNQISKQPMTSRMVIASNDQAAVASLSNLRGFIAPQQPLSLQTSMLQLGLGLNISQLLPAVSELWSATSNASFECAPLVDMQTAMKQSNPLAALAMAGMAGSVQGVSLSLNQLSTDPATGMPAALDALFSVSADNAHSLLQSLLMFYPPLADITFPEVGEAMELNELFPMAAAFGLAPTLMITEEHAMIYQGEQAAAQAQTLAGTALSQNGLLHFAMDYARLFSAMAEAMAATGTEVPPEFEALQDAPYQLDMTLDIEGRGIAIESTMRAHGKAPH